MIIPDEFHLFPVYPNPFNAGANIRFTVKSEDDLEINIFDLTGKRLWHQTARFRAGMHMIKWDGKDRLGNKVPSGTYFLEVSNGTLIKNKKMLLLK